MRNEKLEIRNIIVHCALCITKSAHLICFAAEKAGNNFGLWDRAAGHGGRASLIHFIQLFLNALDENGLLADAAANGDPLQIKEDGEIIELNGNI